MHHLTHRFSFTALLLVLLQVMQVQNGFAQAPLVKLWDKRFGGTDNDYLNSLQQTTDGGYILGGYSLS